RPIDASDGVEPVMAQGGESGEIVTQRDRKVAVEVMVSKRRVDRDSALAPDAGLAVIDLPVFRFVSVVGDVSAKGNKVGLDVSDGADQRLADIGAGGVGVGRISEPGVSVGDEAERQVRL